jgi:hypothetical protein
MISTSHFNAVHIFNKNINDILNLVFKNLINVHNFTPEPKLQRLFLYGRMPMLCSDFIFVGSILLGKIKICCSDCHELMLQRCRCAACTDHNCDSDARLYLCPELFQVKLFQLQQISCGPG